MLKFSPLDHDFHSNPWPVFEEARLHQPVVRHDDLHIPHISLFRHEDVREALSNSDIYSSDVGEYYKQIDGGDANGFILSDPPEHTQMRRIVQLPFMAKFINRLRPDVERIVNTTFDAALSHSGSIDYVKEVANVIPVTALAVLLGIPEEQHPIFKNAADHISEAFGMGAFIGVSKEEIAERDKAYDQLRSVAHPLLEQRIQDPGDDLISVIAQAEKAGHLNRQQSDNLIILALIAGHGTTTRLIGNMMLNLMQFPDQEAVLRDNPSLIPNAVEEILRFNGSARYMQRRLKQDIELHGHSLKEGEFILPWIISANRDPNVFADPHRLDVTRDTRQSLHFSLGRHVCLGRELARLEGQVVLETLLKRTRSFSRSTEAPLPMLASGSAWGFTEIPVDITAA